MKQQLRNAAFCAAMLVGSQAGATVLTFDIAGAANSSEMPQAYGDNVTATTMGGFSYGAAGGFTPNVAVSYASDVNGILNFWSTGYNDLFNVVENEADGQTGYRIEFIAQAGFNVVLDSLNMGNWGSAITVPGLSVADGSGTVLFSATNIALPANSTPSSLFFDFGGISANKLVLHVNTSGLGVNSDNVGLDNIQFSQSTAVPVPAAAWLFGSGLFALAGLARRKAIR